MLRLLPNVTAKLKPPSLSRHPQPMVNYLRDLEVCTHVLVRTDATQRPLQLPCQGAYKVLEHGEHYIRDREIE